MRTVVLLVFANLFMTFAWYAHLKHLRNKPLMVAILVSWGIAFFEYVLQVPANRIGYGHFSLAQLKVIQEIITMSVFAGFAILYMREPIRYNYFIAFFFLVGAAYFMFRK